MESVIPPERQEWEKREITVGKDLDSQKMLSESEWLCCFYSRQYFLSCLGLPYELLPLILPALYLSLVPICSLHYPSRTLPACSLTKLQTPILTFPACPAAPWQGQPGKLPIADQWDASGVLGTSGKQRQTPEESLLPIQPFLPLWTLPSEEVMLSAASATLWP